MSRAWSRYGPCSPAAHHQGERAMRRQSGGIRFRIWASALAALAMGCSASTGGSGVEPDSAMPLGAGISYPVTFRTVVGSNYLCAENGGGGEVDATRTSAQAWETFTLHDVNSGALQDGDVITL